MRDTVNVQNVTELYILKWLILCGMNLPQLKKKVTNQTATLSPQTSWTCLDAFKIIHENFQIDRTLHHRKVRPRQASTNA